MSEMDGSHDEKWETLCLSQNPEDDEARLTHEAEIEKVLSQSEEEASHWQTTNRAAIRLTVATKVWSPLNHRLMLPLPKLRKGVVCQMSRPRCEVVQQK